MEEIKNEACYLGKSNNPPINSCAECYARIACSKKNSDDLPERLKRIYEKVDLKLLF